MGATLMLKEKSTRTCHHLLLIYEPHHILSTHWCRAMHICVHKLTIIVSDNGLLSGRRQAIILTIAGILFIGPLGTNCSENLIKIHTFSFKKIYFKMLFGICRPFCLSLKCMCKTTIHGLRTLHVFYIFYDVMPYDDFPMDDMASIKFNVRFLLIVE